MIKITDFAVDLDAREVRHSSGAIVTFREYESRDEWLNSSTAHIRNADRFPGHSTEFVKAAREAAVAAGMAHKKP